MPSVVTATSRPGNDQWSARTSVASALDSQRVSAGPCRGWGVALDVEAVLAGGGAGRAVVDEAQPADRAVGQPPVDRGGVVLAAGVQAGTSPLLGADHAVDAEPAGGDSAGRVLHHLLDRVRTR